MCEHLPIKLAETLEMKFAARAPRMNHGQHVATGGQINAGCLESKLTVHIVDCFY